MIINRVSGISKTSAKNNTRTRPQHPKNSRSWDDWQLFFIIILLYYSIISFSRFPSFFITSIIIRNRIGKSWGAENQIKKNLWINSYGMKTHKRNQNPKSRLTLSHWAIRILKRNLPKEWARLKVNQKDKAKKMVRLILIVINLRSWTSGMPMKLQGNISGRDF